MVRKVLNLEGAAVLAAVVYVYFFRIDGSRVLFVALLLAPDIGLAAYATGNNRVGSILYNALHTYILPVLLIVSGIVAGSEIIVKIGLISAAHIGMDRTLGYGLKYVAAPKPTHLQKV